MATKYETFNDVGDFVVAPLTRIHVKVRTSDSSLVLIDDSIVAPNSDSDRYASFNVDPQQKLKIQTSGKHTVAIAIINPDGETHSGKRLVNDEEEPETMYDKLRNEMMATLARYAESRDLDIYDDDENYDEDHDDYHDPLSHYEKKLMQEEYLAEQNNNQSTFDEDKSDSPNDSAVVPAEIIEETQNTTAPTP